MDSDINRESVSRTMVIKIDDVINNKSQLHKIATLHPQKDSQK